MLPREHEERERHPAKAPDPDVPRVERLEQATERVLGEAPVVGRLVVVGVEMRHRNEDRPPRSKGAMHALHRAFELEDVLEDVETQDDVIGPLDANGPNVDELVAVLGHHVRLDELVGRVEQPSTGKGIASQVLTAAPDLEDPLAGDSLGERCDIPFDPGPRPEDEMGSGTQRAIREPLTAGTDRPGREFQAAAFGLRARMERRQGHAG